MSLPPDVDVDPAVWRAVIGGGTSRRLPPINSRVYYFPQGKAEQQDVPSYTNRQLLFRVKSIRLLIHPWDELYAEFHLTPISPGDVNFNQLEIHIPEDIAGAGDIITRATTSAAIVEHGDDFYSVPTETAEIIFPPLAAGDEQDLTVHDILGNPWQFRHVHSQQRAHFFTQGWKSLVTKKNMKADAGVIFMRRQSTGELLIGIKHYGCTDRILSDMVQTVAVEGEALVVNYYGKQPNFIVSELMVIVALSYDWRPGCRIKMRVDAEDLSMVHWEEGMIVDICIEHVPWRMLKVDWDSSSMKRRMDYTYVNPWDVELCPCPP